MKQSNPHVSCFLVLPVDKPEPVLTSTSKPEHKPEFQSEPLVFSLLTSKPEPV